MTFDLEFEKLLLMLKGQYHSLFDKRKLQMMEENNEEQESDSESDSDENTQNSPQQQNFEFEREATTQKQENLIILESRNFIKK